MINGIFILITMLFKSYLMAIKKQEQDQLEVNLTLFILYYLFYFINCYINRFSNT